MQLIKIANSKNSQKAFFSAHNLDIFFKTYGQI